ncbi:MAG TPA: FAD-dependent oxidoreductase [bacterium]|nr:FAD-dependent oxidoreductase [bacterium]
MIYDLIIIGAGPAGLTASIYASRYKMSHLVIGEIPGGLITEAHNVCNFPGENEITGFELMEKFQKHAKDLGGEILSMEKIIKIEKDGEIFQLTTQSNKVFSSKTILIATGTKHRKLEIEEEIKYLGKGLAYCATCDAMFFKEKIVGVVGGGNSALTAALYLAEVAEKVYLIARGDDFKGEVVWIDQVKNNPKIEIIYNSAISKLKGDNKLESVELKSTKDEGDISSLDLDGLFVEIGTEPDVLLSEQLSLNLERGYVIVDKEQKTSVVGVWAAGDITTNSASFRQVITSCSEGAVASYSIFSHLQKNRKC